VLAREADAVLLGSAILAATAAGVHPDVLSAMQSMSGTGRTIQPRRETAAYHKAKYQVFRELYRQQLRHREMMEKIRK
jgi:ribulose kinase